MSSQLRTSEQEAYVLHTYSYRETSLIVELFTRQYGRIGVVAKGARRPNSLLRSALQSFQPLYTSWGGRADLKTLYGAELRFGLARLKGKALMSGFYINELILKLLIRDDPHEHLFDVYERAVNALSGQQPEVEKILRRFERVLLAELGYGLTLTHDVKTQKEIKENEVYTYLFGRGPTRINLDAKIDLKLSGKALMDISNDNLEDPATLSQCKLLMRSLVTHHLGNKSLHTRRLLLDLQTN
ncbi:MAG: DNA repair protein RecO [Burkholderiales bacterium]|nr:DNA repair protein RecO [Burkholderiales bacterium]OUT78579.1 MAG: DNA repair protein RecO [Betaproteobacteria bacterium TMED22]